MDLTAHCGNLVPRRGVVKRGEGKKGASQERREGEVLAAVYNLTDLSTVLSTSAFNPQAPYLSAGRFDSVQKYGVRSGQILSYAEYLWGYLGVSLLGRDRAMVWRQ